MGRIRVTRCTHFHYPCRCCGKKHSSMFLAGLCEKEDMKIQEAKQRHLIPISEYNKKHGTGK